MCNLWLKLNSIIYSSATIIPLSVLYALVSRPPLLLLLALSSNLTLMLTHFVTPRWLSLSLSLARFLSLSLSLPIARRTRVPADAFLSRAPPFTLSLALTLSNSLHLSPTLLFPHTHAHLHTHGIVNKAGEQGTLGDQGNRGPRRRRVTHTGPPHHFIWTLGKFEEIVLCVSFGCFFNCRFIAGYGVSIVTTDIYLKDFWTLYLNCHPCAP